MIVETVRLTPFEDATLTSLCISNTEELKQLPRRAVIICPGGGYRMVSDREAEPVAATFLAAGFATFILRYTTGEKAADFAPLKQIALAVKHVREHAAHYNVDADYVFTCGFSAGAHLAASAGVLWQHPALSDVLGEAPTGIARPTGMILCYPVITGWGPCHPGSFRRLCGKEDYTREDAEPFSLELHVDATTPPAFLWHTFTDKVVPVQNSLLFADAMTRAGVPFELHIFPEGPHGLSLCNEQTASRLSHMIQPHNTPWVSLAVQWIRDFKNA